jgi:hypothetical protein
MSTVTEEKYVSPEKRLEKSKMAFELPDGKGIFVLDELDVKAIAKTFWAEVIATDMTRVLMLHDHGFDRANKLYEVYAK